MVENPPRVSRKDGTCEVSKGGPTGKGRHNVDRGGDLIECSGKYCRSCAAGTIADCVAICCCPCALVNFFTLVFVKVPWMICKRCLGRGKRKKKKELEMKRNRQKGRETDGGIVEDRDGNLRNRIVGDGNLEAATVFGEEEEMAGVEARFEAERVWFELYQVGHLGFGRVSFTGIE